MSLADYLAKNYLTADPTAEKKSKKRRRKAGEEAGFVIADDDAPGWGNEESRDGNDDGPLTGNYGASCLLTDLHVP